MEHSTPDGHLTHMNKLYTLQKNVTVAWEFLDEARDMLYNVTSFKFYSKYSSAGDPTANSWYIFTNTFLILFVFTLNIVKKKENKKPRLSMYKKHTVFVK